jgi:hypothetical protein
MGSRAAGVRHHAIAGAPDWLRLSSGIGDVQRIAAVGEILVTSPMMPAPAVLSAAARETQWNEAAFLAAIEDEGSRQRAPCCAGRSRPGAGRLQPALMKAALSQYADFGHALIYTVKTFRLADRLGRRASHFC